VRKLTLLISILIATLAAFGARADEVPDSIEQFNARLDRARDTLDEVQKALEQPELSDAALRSLRTRIDPLPHELEETIEKLTPRLAAIDARLKELAPVAAKPQEPAKEAPKAPEKPAETKPAPKPPAKNGVEKPPPRGPPAPAPEATQSETESRDAAARVSANAELEDQRRLFDATDATLKRARAMLLEARQISVTIVARQRGLFAKNLFLRTSGLFTPSLWRAALESVPGFVSDSASFLSDRAGNVVDRVNSGKRAQFFAVLFLIAAGVVLALFMARRVARRLDGDATPTPLRKAAAAGWTAIVVAAAPVAAVGALSLAFDAFDIVDSTLEPIWRRVVEGVARIAFAYAIARAVFAPSHPNWRLIDPGDRLARLLTGLIALAALTLSAARFVEQLEEATQAGLSLVIVTRGMGVMIVVALISIALFNLPRRAEVEEGGAVATVEGRDWMSAARFFGAVVVIALVAACGAGYVTFANFVILQIGWTAAVLAILYVVVTLLRGGIEAAFAPTSFLGRNVISGFGMRREQLAPLAVLLSGIVTLLCFVTAALVAMAPLGYESGDFLANIRSAFISFKIGDVTISPSSALVAVLVFAAGLAATQGLRRWLDTRFLPLTRLDLGLRNSISATLGYVGFILAAALALSYVGLGFEKLAIVAGALSVGIGFGLQSIVNNFVSGLILLWERAIRVGDWVVVGDEQGYVKRINVRSTEIETFDRATMIVPNSNLVAGVVKNWLRGDKVGRIKIAIAPHAGVDPERMRDILLAAARAQEGVLRIPAPQVMFLGMEANAFKFELWCYVEDVEQSARVRSDLHFDLYQRLDEAGITIGLAAAAPPTIVHIPELDKLAAAAVASALAIEANLPGVKSEGEEPEKSDIPEENAASSEDAPAK
jgi:small-conductance mechanosensitive channel